MIDPSVRRLARRLERLELHAARSGRETLAALIEAVSRCKDDHLDDLINDIHQNVSVLLRVMPPYAPALDSINRVLLLLEAAFRQGKTTAEALDALRSIRQETRSPAALQAKIAEHLVGTLAWPAVVYTHTLSETVLAVLGLLARKGALRAVVVTESRPNNDGWITAKKLAAWKVKVDLMLDAAAPDALSACDLMLAGTEIILQDGSAICKVGTYPAAEFCRQQGKPMYLVAASNKFSPIPWNNRGTSGLSAQALGLRTRPRGVEVKGSYFDTTPGNLITAYATELGLLDAEQLAERFKDAPISPWLAVQAGSSIDTDVAHQRGR